MLKIRTAQESDNKEVLKIFKKLDLFYPSQSLGGFRVAEKDGKIVGVVQLKEYKDFFFLSSLGIVPDYQKRGLATFFLDKVLKNATKNVYLYTTIPDFFKRLGFKTTSPLFPARLSSPKSLPSKESLNCQACCPEKCVCMVKPPHAS